MELWEKRWLHEKCVIDAAYFMNDKTPPLQEKGKLKYDKNIFRTFHGKKFHAELNAAGHDYAEFERCKCHDK